MIKSSMVLLSICYLEKFSLVCSLFHFWGRNKLDSSSESRIILKASTMRVIDTFQTLLVMVTEKSREKINEIKVCDFG